MDEIAYWLALLRAPGVGPARFHELLQHFPSPRAIFQSSPRELAAAGRIAPETARYLENPAWSDVENDLRWLARAGHHALTLHSPEYPPWLREIHAAPPVLHVQGKPSCLASPQIAVVGSRNPTPAGLDLAHEFSAELTRHGFAITSGLAAGIDAAAHRGALDAHGITIAVAGTGLDRVYPARHEKLAAEIQCSGAVVSEFPLGSPPLRDSFPRRNRIISGLSRGTLVVEAALHSGSLITARTALEQGREVFAIPGSIHNPCARGCHALIRQGAKLVESIHDILEELCPVPPAERVLPHADAVRDAAMDSRLDETMAAVLSQIDYAPTTIDTLIVRTHLPSERLCPILLELEMNGHVHAAPGGTYLRRSERK
ncbi:MAG: DNA-protecting protein DprA [Gammaproteobacteria bacterium]|nr:DNA-protecting protein DprA [Gammaproteobacteria bacterium]